MKRDYLYLCADFETVVDPFDLDHTEVWASAAVEFHSEHVVIHNSIDKFIRYLFSLRHHLIVYFHNLKFDGSFILSWLYQSSFKESWIETEQNFTRYFQDMENETFKYSISAEGNWYSITIKHRGYEIQIRDSLKLLPISVEEMGRSFGTKHKKLSIEYEGARKANDIITKEECDYIKNDVLIPKEALEIMSNEGNTRLTIGACCMAKFKSMFGHAAFNEYFPNLYEYRFSEAQANEVQANSIGDYVRLAYSGAWCYVVEEKRNKVYHDGYTADNNSLYPFVMHSKSGFKYPIGEGNMWSGEIPDYVKQFPDKTYYFIRIRCCFYLKDGFLPFIHIKHSFLYDPRECLKTSDICVNGEYMRYITNEDGEIIDTKATLVMTCTDYELFLRHYDVVELEILDGIYFESKIGLFDEYIDYFKKIKMNSTGAKRNIAKLFSNNLYGKYAASQDSSFKRAYLKPDGVLGFRTYHAMDKIPGYIPVGAAVTSYGRYVDITAAQANYYGPDKPGFIYTDTDSQHGDLPYQQLKGMNIDEREYGSWKIESLWDIGYFSRQKTYIEHVTHENLKEVEPHYNIVCAGMPKRCKELFALALENKTIDKETISMYHLNEEEQEFLSHSWNITDFKDGFIIPGKLRPKRVKGGIVLVNTPYTMRKHFRY